MDRRTFLTVTLGLPFFTDVSSALAQMTAKPLALAWTQWGGPNRNFHTDARGLKDTWPATGPRVVWKRPLGDGYSSPAVENGVLYMMYGKPRQEVAMAADAETGKTLWEHATPMTFESDARARWGTGRTRRRSIAGTRLFTTGVAGRLQCLDKKTESFCGRSSSGTITAARK